METGCARDAEGAEVPPVFFVLFAVVVFGHEGDGAEIHVEGVDVVLGKEAYAQPWVLGYEAFRGGELANEEFQDGGLAGAIRPYNADTRVELHV